LGNFATDGSTGRGWTLISDFPHVLSEKENVAMPRGDKSAYTEKQKRQAQHIEEGYEKRGVPDDEAEKRAWATVNKMTGGGKKSGSGRGQPTNTAPARKGGKIGGAAAAARPAAKRSAAAKKAARTRARGAKALTTRKTGEEGFSQER
jgi:hypothetical protein